MARLATLLLNTVRHPQRWVRLLWVVILMALLMVVVSGADIVAMVYGRDGLLVLQSVLNTIKVVGLLGLIAWCAWKLSN